MKLPSADSNFHDSDPKFDQWTINFNLSHRAFIQSLLADLEPNQQCWNYHQFRIHGYVTYDFIHPQIIPTFAH